MKKLFAIVLAVIMCASILSVAAFAAEEITVHAYVPGDWTAPNLYGWPTGDSNPNWPGDPMSQEDGQWYVGTMSIDYTNVIINNNGAQTADLAFDGGYEEIWVVVGNSDGSNATVYYEEPADVSGGDNSGDNGGNNDEGGIVADPDGLFKVPSSLAIVGPGIPGVNSDWNPGEPTGQMTEVSELVYEIEIACPAGTNLEFKFAGNGTWDDSCNLHSGTPVIGGTCEMSNGGGMDNQMKLSVSEAAVLKFTVDLNPLANGTGAATLSIEVTDGEVPEGGGSSSGNSTNGDPDGQFAKPNSLAIVGTGIPGVGEWDPADAKGDMAEVSTGVYEITLACPAGTSMTFKFAGNDAWDDSCNLGSATPAAGVAVELVNGSSAQDMKLSIGTEAEVKFTVDLNPLMNGTGAATLTVEAPDGAIGGGEGGTTTPDGEMVTVHARIPESWGTAPRFWAWNMSTQQNAFEAWPGEAMTKNGEWYEIQIPAWADGVIVNDGGSTQTADLLVEAGKEVWIDVFSFDNCEITYSEPGERVEPTTAEPTPPAPPAPPTTAPTAGSDDADTDSSTDAVEQMKAATRTRVILIVVLVLVWIVVIAEVISIFVPKKN